MIKTFNALGYMLALVISLPAGVVLTVISFVGGVIEEVRDHNSEDLFFMLVMLPILLLMMLWICTVDMADRLCEAIDEQWNA